MKHKAATTERDMTAGKASLENSLLQCNYAKDYSQQQYSSKSILQYIVLTMSKCIEHVLGPPCLLSHNQITK